MSRVARTGHLQTALIASVKWLPEHARVFANCSQLTVGYSESNEIYRFWELDDQRDMYWLPAGSIHSYANGEPLRMAGGTDSLVTTAFATLCPSKFRALGARTGN